MKLNKKAVVVLGLLSGIAQLSHATALHVQNNTNKPILVGLESNGQCNVSVPNQLIKPGEQLVSNVTVPDDYKGTIATGACSASFAFTKVNGNTNTFFMGLNTSQWASDVSKQGSWIFPVWVGKSWECTNLTLWHTGYIQYCDSPGLDKQLTGTNTYGQSYWDDKDLVTKWRSYTNTYPDANYTKEINGVDGSNYSVSINDHGRDWVLVTINDVNQKDNSSQKK